MRHDISKTLIGRKHGAVVDAFLLFNYRRASDAQKHRYEEETNAERIARTMRLEGDNVTAEDVRRFLKH